MFDRDYTFKGRHSNIVTKLTSEIDGETNFKIFERNIDVLIISAIIGYLYGRMSNKDDSGLVTSDNVKKINFDQINKESNTLNYNYELIMLLHEKNTVSIEERLNRAFRYEDGSDEKKQCFAIFEKYVLGGIDILNEKILVDANNVDDYINNLYNFLNEYNERYNSNITDNEIIDLCTNI